MIELKQVCAGYGTKEVLHNIHMKFETGRITALIGPNGCGKSTLLKSVVRIIPHTSGEILVDGRAVESYRQTELARKTAYLSQGKNVPDISVLRMVLHGRFAYLSYPRRYREEDIRIAREALTWVGLGDLEEENVRHLSGGMRQSVYIAMALAQDADTVLMDEPTTYLDASHQLKVMELARKLAEKGKAVVLVLHDLSQALRTADYVYVLRNGTVETEGSPEKVYESGRLEEVFGVSVEHILSRSGEHYVCY